MVAHNPKRVNFEREPASREAMQKADWVVDSGDNRRMPFVIVDKTDAKVLYSMRTAAPRRSPRTARPGDR